MMKATHRVWIFYDLKKSKESKPLTLTQAQIFILNMRIKDFDQFLVWTPGWVQWTPLSVFLDSEQKIFTSMKIPKPKQIHVTPSNKLELVDDDTQSKSIKSKRNRKKTIPKNPMNSVMADPHEHHTMASQTTTDMTLTAEGVTSSIFQSTQSLLTTDVEEIPNATHDYGYYFNDFSIHDVKKIARKKSGKVVIEEKVNQRHYMRENMHIEVILISANGISFRTYSNNVSLGGVLLEDKVPQEYAKHPFDIVFINKFESDQRQARLLLRCKVVGDVTKPERLIFVSPNKEALVKLNFFIQTYKNHANKSAKAV